GSRASICVSVLTMVVSCARVACGDRASARIAAPANKPRRHKVVPAKVMRSSQKYVVVGWVERSETHHANWLAMGFAALNPSYGGFGGYARDRHRLIRASAAGPFGPNGLPSDSAISKWL